MKIDILICQNKCGPDGGVGAGRASGRATKRAAGLLVCRPTSRSIRAGQGPAGRPGGRQSVRPAYWPTAWRAVRRVGGRAPGGRSGGRAGERAGRQAGEPTCHKLPVIRPSLVFKAQIPLRHGVPWNGVWSHWTRQNRATVRHLTTKTPFLKTARVELVRDPQDSGNNHPGSLAIGGWQHQDRICCFPGQS